MKTTTKNTGIKVTTGVKAGGWGSNANHTRSALKVTTSIKAGMLVGARNHSRSSIALA